MLVSAMPKHNERRYGANYGRGFRRFLLLDLAVFGRD